MKKTYICPESHVIKINSLSAILTTSYTNQEADSDAEVLSREGGLIWEEEEVQQ